MKEDLSIVESVAMFEQLKREGKPLGEKLDWHTNYVKYLSDKSEDKKLDL